MPSPPANRTALPTPPYVAVVFVSRRTVVDDEGYAAMAEQMETLAAQRPGYLGIDAVRDPATRVGITISYWRDAASARAWKQVGEHLVAQQLGRERWYEWYETHVATVERSYAGPG